MRPPDDDLPKRLPPLGWRSLPECRPPDASPSMFIDTRSCALMAWPFAPASNSAEDDSDPEELRDFKIRVVPRE